MTRRATALKSHKDEIFNHLAAQLGVSRHLLALEAVDEGSRKSDGVDTQRSELVMDDDEHLIDEEINIESPNDEEDAGEISLTLPSDSASEGISSDLSLPHSFGHYDQLPTGRGISHFDDHLIALSPGLASSHWIGKMQQNAPCETKIGTKSATSEAVMKKFYEIQVGKIRAQLALSMQSQRELERMLQEERTLWLAKECEMKDTFTNQQDRLMKELEQARDSLETAQTRLRMEKTHLATLQISDALAEQLSRQNEEDLSIREYLQLSVHFKVRKLELELNQCRQELVNLEESRDAEKAAAAGALCEVDQMQRIADAKERRLQRELELSEATRHELENEIKALVDQMDELKKKERHNEEMYSDQRGLQEESQRLKSDVERLQHEYNEVKSRFDESLAESGELRGTISLLTADKTFLQNAKMQLEAQVVRMQSLLKEKQEKIKSLQEKHDVYLGESVQLQNETRLHFETKFDNEMTKFMDISKCEIERIRNDGQVVYERENRLLKEVRDDALKHVEMLQARLNSVQFALDEKVLAATRTESMHTTALATARNELKMRHFEISQLKLTLEEKVLAVRNAGLEIEMLTRKVETHKDEFARLETTSTTRITQLEATLEVERIKLKEYELLEIDLDGAVLQTGEIAATEDGREKAGDEKNLKLQEVMTTFGAIPTTTKRRFQQSVLLAQRVVKSQREAIALEQKLNEVTKDHSRLQQESIELKAKLASFHQPQSYLIDKLTRREQELQGAIRRHQEVQSKLQELRAQYRLVQDANTSLQQQLQQLLSRRGDLDALKSTVQLLRSKLQDGSEYQPLSQEMYRPVTKGAKSRDTKANAVDPTSASPINSVSKVSPSPFILSKMTKPPPSVRRKEQLINDRHAPDNSSSSSSISSAPKWYKKLRATCADGQDGNKSI